MLTQQVAVWIRMQNAKNPFVTALRNTLLLMENAKQVSLTIDSLELQLILSFANILIIRYFSAIDCFKQRDKQKVSSYI